MHINEILWECEIRGVDLRISCAACRFVTEAPVGEVASRYGPRLSLNELEGRICCPQCGGEGMVVNPVHPYHRPLPGRALRFSPVRPHAAGLALAPSRGPASALPADAAVGST